MTPPATHSRSQSGGFQYIIRLAYSMIPTHFLSYLVGKFARIRISWIKNLCIRSFIKLYQVNTQEVANPDLASYQHFTDFFIRKLKPQARPILADANTLAFPADGLLSQWGSLRQDCFIHAKGHDFTVTALLGGDKALAQLFQQGMFATFYLAPRDYHRVHMPIAGSLTQMTAIRGRLFPVKPATVNSMPDLFARNERVVCVFNTMFGTMAIVLVGALNVGSIHTPWHGQVKVDRKHKIQHWHYENIHLASGDELGYFALGSTVILLTSFQLGWHSTVKSSQHYLTGQPLAKPSAP